MGPASIEGDASEWTGGPLTRGLRVDTGNPHIVLEVGPGDPGLLPDEIDLVALGEAVNAKVPGGANVHLLSVAAPGIAIRSYERGVGLTQACGTGACASAAAARAWGLVDDPVPVAMPGGDAVVTLGPEARDVVLRGPATYIGAVELGESPWR